MTSFLNSIGKRKKSPEQLVTSSKQALQTIIDCAISKEDEKTTAMESLNKYLIEIKNVLYGSVDSSEVDEEKVMEVSKYAQSEGLFITLISNIDSISFEARKDTALIFNNLVRKNICNFAQYLAENVSIVENVIQGYNSSESALSCGSMLRETIRHENLSRYILYSDHFWAFFDVYVHLPNFEVASDAFNTLRDLLTTPKHKNVSEEFMESNCDKFLEKYDVLLQSDNYVTRRRSLKLLSEILLDRSNYTVMMRYISSKHHLKTIMNLLRHKSAQIQLETFHVFKIFVANPNKTPEIESILFKNRVKLMAYLEAFHTDNEDPQFVDEKRLLIDTLQQLTDAPEPPHEHHHASSSSSAHHSSSNSHDSASSNNDNSNSSSSAGNNSNNNNTNDSNTSNSSNSSSSSIDNASQSNNASSVSISTIASANTSHSSGEIHSDALDNLNVDVASKATLAAPDADTIVKDALMPTSNVNTANNSDDISISKSAGAESSAAVAGSC